MNISSIIHHYKQYLQATRLKDELYKWQMIKHYHGRPDVNASNFAEEYKSIKFGNLIYQLTTGVGNHICRENPEGFRDLFKALFDENTTLTDRIAQFGNGALQLYREIGMDKGHHQDERAISVYLTLHDPEKYTFYKSSYYRAYCQDLGIKPQSSGLKYSHYLELLHDLIETHLKHDQELAQLVTEILTENDLPFSWLLLAQDVLFFTYESNEKDPQDSLISVKDAFASWLVNNPKADYFDNDKQRLLNELSGYEDYFDFPLFETKKSEVQNLIADIEEVIYAEDNSQFVQYSERTSSHRPRAILGKRNYFKFLEEYFSDQVTDFKHFIRSFNQQQLGTYFSFLARIIKTFDLKPGDERLTFNYYDNRIVFTVGQRYVWGLLHNDPTTAFIALSQLPISQIGEFFDGSEPQPFLNRFSSFELTNEQEQLILDGIREELRRTKKSSYRKKHHKLDFETYVFDFIKKSSMKTPLNQILYGPPGTGKTYTLKTKYFPLYTTKETALTKEKHFEEVVRDLTWWQVIAAAVIQTGKTKVGNLLNHPWILQKAKMSTSNTVRPTLWGQLQSHTIDTCEFVNVKAKQQPFIFNKTEDSYWEIIEEEVKEQYPEIYDIIDSVENFNPNPDREIKRYVFTTFHQSFNYEDFIEGIKPVLSDESENGEVAYRIEDGIFKALCKRAESDPENRYAIFIDEINRGNVSSIFGELITLIETDKRKGAEHAMSATLPYSKKQFAVPSNVDIYGTMNTADRSVEALDTALRRRFSFSEMLPQPALLQNQTIQDINLKTLLEILNERIEVLVDRDHTIGHAFFMSVSDLDSLRATFANKVIPLLQEYFYGDYAKMEMVIGTDFFHVSDKTKVKFAVKSDDYDAMGKVYHVKNFSDKNSFSDEEFISALTKLMKSE